MRPPRRDALEMLLVKIARPPGTFRNMAGEIDHMLARAAAGLHHVTGFPGKKLLQHRTDRALAAVKRRRVETTVGFDRPAILAEFHDIFSHDVLSFQIAVIDLLEHLQHGNARLSATTIIS